MVLSVQHVVTPSSQGGFFNAPIPPTVLPSVISVLALKVNMLEMALHTPVRVRRNQRRRCWTSSSGNSSIFSSYSSNITKSNTAINRGSGDSNGTHNNNNSTETTNTGTTVNNTYPTVGMLKSWVSTLLPCSNAYLSPRLSVVAPSSNFVAKDVQQVTLSACTSCQIRAPVAGPPPEYRRTLS